MTEFRVRRVERLLQESIDEIIRFKIKAPLLPMVSIVGVRVSGDLRHAKVFLSAVAGEEETTKAVELLQPLKGKIRFLLGRQIRLRYTPEIEFIADDSIAKGSHILEIIKEISKPDDERNSGSEQTQGDDIT